MLINSNLLTTNKVKIGAADHTHNFKIIDLPINLVEGKKYTISCNCQFSKGGEGSLIIADFKNMSPTSNRAIFKEDTINEFSFVYKPDRTNRILLYAGVAGYTNNIEGLYYNLKLEEGDKATPYIPNENTIETAKRQHFIGGGVRSKRYSQSLKLPKQSSYRKEVAA